MGRAVMRGGNLLLHSGRGTFDMATSKSTTVQSLALVDMEGQELVRFVEHTQERDLARQEFNEEKNFSELDTWAVGDGVVYTVPVRDRYLIRKRDLQGGEVATFEREFTTREREQEDKDDLTSGMRIIINGVNQEIDKHVLDTDPALMNISVTPDGRLFVTNCWGQRKLLPDGVAARVDVIGDDGSFIEELTLEVPEFNRKQDRLMFLDGKHWLLIRNFDSASESMNAGFGGGDEEDGEDLGEVEPLEVVLYVMPD